MPLLTRWLTDLRLSRIAPRLGPRVLDAGCGIGELLEVLPARVAEVVCADASPLREEPVLGRARRLPIPVHFVLCDVNAPPLGLPPGPYDTIVMGALLEHLRPPVRALAAVRALLKEDGELILTTPTPLGGFLHKLGSYVRLVTPEAAHEHYRFYDRRDIEELLVRDGFVLTEYRRFLFGLNQLAVARKASP